MTSLLAYLAGTVLGFLLSLLIVVIAFVIFVLFKLPITYWFASWWLIAPITLIGGPLGAQIVYKKSANRGR
jgi:hypothetical protein